MFFIGSNVMDWPLETARAVTDGEGVSFAAFFLLVGC
jgi:hypothetical protein